MQTADAKVYINRVRVQLVSENLPEYKVTDSFSAKKLVCDYLRSFDRECVIAVMLGSTKKVMAIHEVSVGIVDGSMIHPREVFKAAILANASSIIIAHNHPSGEIEPSKLDIQITERLREAGKIIGIEVLDHLIVGDDDCYSFAENNM